MIIGIPKEIMPSERRVAATPDSVKQYVADGHKVLVEKNAGLGALYEDQSYKDAGAEIIDKAQELYDKAELILKVKEPLFNKEFNKHEVDMMHKGQYLITFIHPAAPVNHEMVKNMAKRGVISMSIEGVPRISRAQSMDALTSMSTCAGYKGMLMGVSDMEKFAPMMPTAAGLIPPANVMVIGVGVAGLQALATAKRLGAVTYSADIRPAAAEQGVSLGAKNVDLGVDPKLAIGEGGYALALSDDVLIEERKKIEEVLPKMDIVFCSALVPGRLAPILITEEMTKKMKRGSVIVDIAIDQGGNCEITDPGVTSEKNGIILEGIKNIPGRLATSSTYMYSANMCSLVKYLIKDNKISLDTSDEIVDGMLTTLNGEVVHQGAREAMGMGAK